MIVNEKAVEFVLLQGQHHLKHIAVAFVNKTFGEVIARAFHIAEVDIEQPVLLTKMLYALHHPCAPAHFAPAAVTIIQAMHRAGVGIHRGLKVLKVAKQTRHTA